MSEQQYYLIDLERSVQTSALFFWKANKRGYTLNRQEAGLYGKKEALELVLTDRDERTACISTKAVEKILNF